MSAGLPESALKQPVEQLISRLVVELDCVRDNLRSAQESGTKWALKAQELGVKLKNAHKTARDLEDRLIDRARDVRNFFVAANKEDEVYKTPSTSWSGANMVTRRCIKLVVEETFELLEAAFDDVAIKGLKNHTIEVVGKATFKLDMVKVADALTDIDYVVEGVRQVLGIDGAPLWRLVHAANMDKFRDGPKYRDDGKVMKPADWKEPDIAGELRRQGWPG